MPPVHSIEITIFAAALVIFSLVPSILALAENRRRRRHQPVAPAAVFAGGPQGAVVAVEPDPSAAKVPTAGSQETSVLEAPSAPTATPFQETGITPQSPSIETTPAPTPSAADDIPRQQDDAPPVASTEPADVEKVDEGTCTFRLEDLRRARALETPDREALQEQTLQQAWEDGLQLADRYAAEIGRTLLSASFEPQARAFHEMRTLGESRELRFLLFPTLWPTAFEQAAAEAVFEIGPTGVVSARVVRRVPT